MTATTSSIRIARQAIGTIGLGLGLGVGGSFPLSEEKITLLLAILGCGLGAHLIFSPDLPGRHRIAQGCAFLGMGAGIGVGGTFPDGTEWFTWLLCAILCLVGTVLLIRRNA